MRNPQFYVSGKRPIPWRPTFWKKLQELVLFAKDKKTLAKCHPCDTLSERQMKVDPSWVELVNSKAFEEDFIVRHPRYAMWKVSSQSEPQYFDPTSYEWQQLGTPRMLLPSIFLPDNVRKGHAADVAQTCHASPVHAAAQLPGYHIYI